MTGSKRHIVIYVYDDVIYVYDDVMPWWHVTGSKRHINMYKYMHICTYVIRDRQQKTN